MNFDMDEYRQMGQLIDISIGCIESPSQQGAYEIRVNRKYLLDEKTPKYEYNKNRKTDTKINRAIYKSLGIELTEYEKMVEEAGGWMREMFPLSGMGMWELTLFKTKEEGENFANKYLEHYLLMAKMAG